MGGGGGPMGTGLLCSGTRTPGGLYQQYRFIVSDEIRILDFVLFSIDHLQMFCRNTYPGGGGPLIGDSDLTPSAVGEKNTTLVSANI